MEHETLSLSVVALLAIISVTLIATHLVPGGTSVTPNSISGRAVDFSAARRPITAEFSFHDFDLNKDGRFDFYDYQDVLAGKVNCRDVPCDLDQDGFLTEEDHRTFNLLVRRVYDYDNNGKLNREDGRALANVLLGSEDFTENHVYDLDNNGYLDKEDLSLYTSLIFSSERPSW